MRGREEPGRGGMRGSTGGHPLPPSSSYPAPLFLITVFYDGHENQGTIWTGCIGAFTPGISMRTSASKVVAEPHSQKSRSQPRAGPAVCVGKLQGLWRELVRKGPQLTLGVNFPMSSGEHSVTSPCSHMAQSFSGCEMGNRLDSWQQGSPGCLEWTERSPVAIHEGDASCD